MNECTMIQQQNTATSTLAPLFSGVLQRGCACGQHGRCECQEYNKNREGTSKRAAISPPAVNEELLIAPPRAHEAK